ncbi:hypothetical protein [Kangiella koreensis]|uniref:Uncharacterized protein n=1 Tax=Kangiella koreensis (strain DSM 16069 / JCM 12317 / KCTC 12182 / SW-125) TaxID=523791 RepID=C7R916_KANKD|nr:hypothetical protein [Kangiella koreensis]ACV27806.1 hypothetical protein Kkor_2397 [Kangiella koreensis DSM 16069]
MKKKLLALSAVIGLVIAGTSYANEADSKKQQDLQTCEAKAKQLPEEVREKQQKTCECIVDNTDYEAIVEAESNGDAAKVQEVKTKARQACRGS